MKKPDPGKFKKFRKLESLEVYMVAAENPVGKKQLRPIFRRKRSREILTREQVTAIKRGRKVLRREMKERGLTRRIDFELTATNLGLYFDRNRLLWPFFLWLIKDNTVAKILATTAVLTTVVTVTQPVIEYVVQYVTQYVTQYIDRIVTEYIDRIVEEDRFTISLSDEMFAKGFELCEEPTFQEPKERLVCTPATNVSPISISDLPADIDQYDGSHNSGRLPTDPTDPSDSTDPTGDDESSVDANLGGSFSDTYFAYTFYCRFINQSATTAALENPNVDLMPYATNYKWELQINYDSMDPNMSDADPEATGGGNSPADAEDPTVETEVDIEGEDSGPKPTDAVWFMVIQDGEVILCAKAREDGSMETLPSKEILADPKTARAFVDRTEGYINGQLAQIDPRLNMNNVGKLETLFSTQEEIDNCRKQIDTFLSQSGVKDLTQLMIRTAQREDQYKVVAARRDQDYYQVIPQDFHSDTVVATRERMDVLPWVEGRENMHKYTVVFWLEGDDPQCTNKMMNAHIGLTFQIMGEEEDPDAENPNDGGMTPIT